MGINNPINTKELASIYNIFDLYVQYANSEGFGMPQLEAAQCGVPVISVRYSAMESIIDNIEAWGVEPLCMVKEVETGCNRAVPNNEEFVDLLSTLTHPDKDLAAEGSRQRDLAMQKYSWDQTAKVWEERIKEIEFKDRKETWESPADIKMPSKEIPKNLTPTQKADYLFDYVLCLFPLIYLHPQIIKLSMRILKRK